VISTFHIDMVNEAVDMVIGSQNIVIKIPMTSEGLKTVKTLSKMNIKTHITFDFFFSQLGDSGS
jgi:transaldolase